MPCLSIAAVLTKSCVCSPLVHSAAEDGAGVVELSARDFFVDVQGTFPSLPFSLSLPFLSPFLAPYIASPCVRTSCKSNFCFFFSSSSLPFCSSQGIAAARIFSQKAVPS